LEQRLSSYEGVAAAPGGSNGSDAANRRRTTFDACADLDDY
jgi:hypothetical protein